MAARALRVIRDRLRPSLRRAPVGLLEWPHSKCNRPDVDRQRHKCGYRELPVIDQSEIQELSSWSRSDLYLRLLPQSNLSNRFQ